MVIRLLRRLMRITRCGASMAAPRRLTLLWPVAWAARACWARAAWACVVRLVWGRVPWGALVLAPWAAGCAAWAARVLLGCVASVVVRAPVVRVLLV